MNFFERQDKARMMSFRLVLLMIMAVLAVVITTNIFALLILGLLNLDDNYDSFSAFIGSIDPMQFWVVSLTVLIFVLFSCLKKINFLKSGGRVVAQAMGGTLVTYNSENLRTRQLLNIVEEMAIASGIPVPRVYLLNNEQSINAFAAGYNLNDVVIGVTKGATEYLTREELQGVIAHEFSHILNGDMRHNMNLSGLVHGVQSIGLLGFELLSMHSHNVGGRYERNNRMPVHFMFFGLGLIVIGYTGTLFGNIIKASFSRQREYLADASAVQFTRNNQGIAGALKKIGGYSKGATVRNPRVNDFSHGMFADGVVDRFFELLSTHPPLKTRIKALDPLWRESFESVTEKSTINAETAMGFSNVKSSDVLIESAPNNISGDNPAMIEIVGQLRDQNLIAAKQILSDLPPVISQKMHTLRGAQAIVFSLFIEPTQNNNLMHIKQFDYLKSNEPKNVVENVMEIFELVKEQDIAKRLPLIDICLPQLRGLSFYEYEQFKKTLTFLINADNKISMFEWAGRQMILNYLANEFEFIEKPKSNIRSISAVHAQLESVMTMLLVNFVEPSEHLLVINNAKSIIGIQDLEMLPTSMLTMQACFNAVESLKPLKPRLKERVIRFVIFIVTQDKHFSIEEHETIRAICEVLDVPMPMPNLQHKAASRLIKKELL